MSKTHFYSNMVNIIDSDVDFCFKMDYAEPLFNEKNENVGKEIIDTIVVNMSIDQAMEMSKKLNIILDGYNSKNNYE